MAALLLCVTGGCRGSDRFEFDPSEAVWQSFSGEKALAYAAQILELGPRPPGSDALEVSRVYLENQLQSFGWTVQRQTFDDATPRGPVTFVNLRARFTGTDTATPPGDLWERPIRALVCSHYDTKLIEDFTFLGANDPVSSMAALLEIARVAAENPDFARHLELVFFDGEEAFVKYTATDGLYGSRYYAERLRKWPGHLQPAHGVLLDMVGDQDLKVRVPKDSPYALVQRLFLAAEEAGHRAHFGMGDNALLDDHVPLNNAGVPTIDLIDFDYPYWHTSSDTLDKLSAASLEIIGQTTVLLLEQHLVPEE